MKKIFLLIAILSFTTTIEAKVWRVNNNPGYNADVQQGGILFDGVSTVANPEAIAGDTLHFEPSPTDYSYFAINEANIVLLGYGYFLSNNTGSQAMPNNAAIAGMEITASAAGSKVLGLEISGTLYISAANVLVSRCYFAVAPYLYNINTNVTGIRFDKCFFSATLEQQTLGSAAQVNLTVENCIFSSIGAGCGVGINLQTSKVKGIIRNNIFNCFGYVYCFNMYIANNIFIGQGNFGGVASSGNNIFRNNMFSFPQSNTQLNPTANPQINNTAPNSGNQFNINMATVFVGTPDNTWNGTSIYNNRIEVNGSATNIESRFDFVGGSNPALNAGESGLTLGGATVTTPNLGAFGATDPYRKGGFPPIPRITSLTVPASVPTSNTSMTISVSSTNNN